MEETRQGHTGSPQSCKAPFYLSELNQWKVDVIEGIKQHGIITPRTVSHSSNSPSREVGDRDPPQPHPETQTTLRSCSLVLKLPKYSPKHLMEVK